MTKFFRHIRLRLLSESKSLKYVKYAVGEIVLVVVGILIALYLNNWNQNRVDKKEEAILKDAIAKKIEFNSFQHRTGLEIYEAALHSAKTLVKLSGKPVDQRTSVQIEQSLFDLRKRFLMGKSNQISIYDELISSGKLNLLASKELRQNLTSLKGNLQLLASYEDDQTNFVDNHLSPFLNTKVDFILISNNAIKNDTINAYQNLEYSANSTNESALQSLLIDRTFLNLMLELVTHTNNLLPIYKRIGKNIETIQAEINQ